MKKNFKILHLLSNRWRSAITEYCVNAMYAMQSEGAENQLVALHESPAMGLAEKYNLPAIGIRGFGVAKIFEVSRIAARFKPDAIICYGGPENFLADMMRITRPFTDIKYIRFIGSLGSGKKGLLAPSGYLFPSEFLKIKFNLAMQSEQKSCCIPLATLPSFAFAMPKGVAGEDSSKTQHIKFVFVGRFDPVKGFDDLFRMHKKFKEWLTEAGYATSLDIIGREENLNAEDLHLKAKRNELSAETDYRIVTERLDNLAQVISQATYGLITSTGSEYISRVAQEFLCCGTPIVVSGVSSLGEYENESGYEYNINYRGNLESLDKKQFLENITQLQAESALEKSKRAEAMQRRFGFRRFYQDFNRFLQNELI